jgi:hypothetical protein
MTAPLNSVATVTRRIAVGNAGQVTLPTIEGFKVFLARVDTPGTIINEGTPVRIVAVESPTSVIVQPLS